MCKDSNQRLVEADLHFDGVLGVLDVLQRSVDVERHHQAAGEPQRVVRLPRGLYDGGCRSVDLFRNKTGSNFSNELQFSVKTHLMDALVHLLGQSELQKAALSQGRLEDLHQFCWFAGRQPRHQLQKFIHKTVLEVRQLRQEQPEGTRPAQS